MPQQTDGPVEGGNHRDDGGHATADERHAEQNVDDVVYAILPAEHLETFAKWTLPGRTESSAAVAAPESPVKPLIRTTAADLFDHLQQPGVKLLRMKRTTIRLVRTFQPLLHIGIVAERVVGQRCRPSHGISNVIVAARRMRYLFTTTFGNVAFQAANLADQPRNVRQQNEPTIEQRQKRALIQLRFRAVDFLVLQAGNTNRFLSKVSTGIVAPDCKNAVGPGQRHQHVVDYRGRRERCPDLTDRINDNLLVDPMRDGHRVSITVVDTRRRYRRTFGS